MPTQTDLTAATIKACEDAGLSILGPCDPTIHGSDGAVVVVCSLTSPRLKALEDAGYRLCPSGMKHTIVDVPRARSRVRLGS